MLPRDANPSFGATVNGLPLWRPPNRRLRVAVIGAGRWGKNLLRVFGSLPNARVVAACDTDPSQMETLTFPIQRDVDPHVTLARSDVDAVAIATPPASHARLASEALAAHKHVFVEKPMALSLGDALRVHHTAMACERRVMVGFVLQHHPAARALAELVQSGTLGEVSHLHARRGGGRRNGAEHPVWWSLAPHDVSLAQTLFDRPARWVSAQTRSTSSTEETVSARVEFSDQRTATIELTNRDGPRRRRVVVVGTRGIAVFDDVDATKLRLYRALKHVPERLSDLESMLEHQSPSAPSLSASEPLEIEVSHFVDALLGGTAFHVGMDHALDVVAVLASGERSMLGMGAPVNVEDWRSRATQHDYAASSCSSSSRRP